TQIVWLDVSADAETIVRRIAEEPHTYFPVCEGDIDKLLGIVNIKELWKRQVAEGRFPDLRSCVAETTFVPDAMPALRLLETFKRTGQPIAVVLDEYGGIAGLATLHDMLEGVVGDIRDEPDTVEDRAVQRPDGSWLLDGMLPIDELMHVLDIPT